MTRIVLLTLSQAHTFDLALEYQKTGQLTRLMSGYPKGTLLLRGFASDVIDSCSSPFLAWMAATRLNRSIEFRARTEIWPKVAIDRYASKHLPECDLFISTSSVGLHAGREARKRGALWVCDRPCSHILKQDELLRQEYDLYGKPFPGISRSIIERELAEYQEADVVLVASRFSERSFLERGFPQEKLWVIPYGLNFSAFQPVPPEPRNEFVICYAGQITIRKGLRYLLSAFERLPVANKRLEIIGTVSDEGDEILKPYRNDTRVRIHGHVSRGELVRLFSNSDVFVLPSVEDGYGMVVAQALACGCPVIVSENAGSADVVLNGVNGYTFPARDIEALEDRLNQIAEPAKQHEMASGAVESASRIGGWDAFASAILAKYEGLLDHR